MSFDTLFCVGILTLVFWIALLIIAIPYLVSHRFGLEESWKPFLDFWEKHSKEIPFGLLCITPFVIAYSGILSHSHRWFWYVGCALVATVLASVVLVTLIKKIRASVGKSVWPSLVTMWGVLVIVGTVLVVL